MQRQDNTQRDSTHHVSRGNAHHDNDAHHDKSTS